MKDVYLGCDVGKKGGLVFMDKDMNIVEMNIMPVLGKEYDLQKLYTILKNKELNVLHAVIENVHAIQGKHIGNSSNFSFGLGKGILMGLMAGAEIPFTLVNPKAWQKVAWEGVTKQANTKDTSLIAAQRVFPSQSFLATQRSRVPHDGLVDAALMAYYIKLKLN